ncbi:hypothetical protein GCM10027413_24510 [Conyzicola nivalis]|uniref:Uncharacterized protein n=1 Tax=Conyzicola nivalis TaxID=1477021 RepID=A0A916SAP8_9MICO|nr:hypothetical protein [Conyzicola nivalis]GGA91019.1 hypothetical protein GCM10010979_02110 [Conyzicola nivalis]
MTLLNSLASDGPGGCRIVIRRALDVEVGDWSDEYESGVVETTLHGSGTSVTVMFADGQSHVWEDGDEHEVFRC